MSAGEWAGVVLGVMGLLVGGGFGGAALRHYLDIRDRMTKVENSAESAHDRIDDIKDTLREAISEFRENLERLRNKIYD